MKFSILIPVYNTSEYLERCFASVSNQSFGDFEVIVTDDGSTDGTSGALCDRFAASDKRARVFHQSNKGLLMTRREAIEKARGEYILFLDSDDWWENDILEKLNGELEKHDPDMIIFRHKYVTPFRTVNDEPLYSESGIITDKSELLKYVVEEKINNIWSKCVKRSVIDHDDYSEYADVTLGEDLLQTIPLFENADKILYMNELLYDYRINDSSMVHLKFSIRAFIGYMKVSEYVDKYINRYKINEDELLLIHHRVVVEKTIKMIRDIALLDISFKEKAALYSEMKRNEYFLSIMRSFDKRCLKKGLNESLFDMYYKSKYRQLVLCVRFSDIPNRLKRSVKKILKGVKALLNIYERI